MTTLKHLVQRSGPLDYRRAVRYVQEVAQELERLHATGEFHHNISPANLYLDENGQACLGANRLASDDSEQYSIGDDDAYNFDVVDCLAPEQALSCGAVDGRADIYSLGCTLYYLLTGSPPFPEGSISERLLQHQIGTPVSIRERRPDVPLALVDLCEKMMAKKQADRLQSVREVDAELAICLLL